MAEMKWIEDLKENLNRLAGEETQKEVMAGSEGLSKDSSAEELASWFRGAVERLDELVDEDTRKRVLMDSCPDVFPEERIRAMRARYRETGDLDGLIREMHEDGSWYGLSWYEYPERRGESIFVRKIPFNPKGYNAAKEPEERRLNYCHCRVVKSLMRSGERISPTFCFCGANWYRQLWDGILGKPVEIEVLKTIVRGDDTCEFLIHLPIGASVVSPAPAARPAQPKRGRGNRAPRKGVG